MQAGLIGRDEGDPVVRAAVRGCRAARRAPRARTSPPPPPPHATSLLTVQATMTRRACRGRGRETRDTSPHVRKSGMGSVARHAPREETRVAHRLQANRCGTARLTETKQCPSTGQRALTPPQCLATICKTKRRGSHAPPGMMSRRCPRQRCRRLAPFVGPSDPLPAVLSYPPAWALAANTPTRGLPRFGPRLRRNVS